MTIFLENENQFRKGTKIYTQAKNIKTQNYSLDQLTTSKRNISNLVVLPKSSYFKTNPPPIILRDSVNVYPSIFETPIKYYIGKWR